MEYSCSANVQLPLLVPQDVLEPDDDMKENFIHLSPTNAGKTIPSDRMKQGKTRLSGTAFRIKSTRLVNGTPGMTSKR